MEPFTVLRSKATPLDRVGVDTDQIVPKQFLKLVNRDGFGKYLFYDWRFDIDGKPRKEFVLNSPKYSGRRIMIARENFGSGSSREHAAWAVLDYGFRAIIAPSYADIFYNNCFKNGVLPVTLPDPEVEELFRRAEKTEGDRLTVDLENQTIADETGLKLAFKLDPFRRECLLKGLDDIGLSLRRQDKITPYEKENQPPTVL